MCDGGNYTCIRFLASVIDTAIPVLPLLMFSLVTYFLRDEIFQAWIRFAIWWVPLTMVVIAISPGNDSTFLAPSTKAIFGLLFLILFVVVSIAIIIRKLVATPSEKTRQNWFLMPSLIVGGFIIAILILMTIGRIL